MGTKPVVIEKDGRKEIVVIPYDAFVAMKNAIEDYEDLRDLREAKAEGASDPGIPLSKLKADLVDR